MVKPVVKKVMMGVPAVALSAALACTMAGCGGTEGGQGGSGDGTAATQAAYQSQSIDVEGLFQQIYAPIVDGAKPLTCGPIVPGRYCDESTFQNTYDPAAAEQLLTDNASEFTARKELIDTQTQEMTDYIETNRGQV